MPVTSKIAILGGGAFGTALASVICQTAHETWLYVRDTAVAHQINRHHKNPTRLADVTLPDQLRATSDLADIADCRIVLFAVPAQSSRQLATMISPIFGEVRHVVVCAKGLERQTGCFQHQILAEFFDQSLISVLSGPSFAKEIARGLPTALTLASVDLTTARELASLLSVPSFRLYASDDRIGVAAGGALKNVLAIGVGIARGMGLGASAEAALIARGFAELGRLGEALGAKSETIAGLSGLGDLALTCSSRQSRNFAYGIALGRGEPMDNLPLAEGVHTAEMAEQIALEHNVEAPIITTVAKVLAGQLSPRQAVDTLLSRPLRGEAN